MLVLKPIPHETIWGGQKLKKIFPSTLKTIGHLYSAIATETQSNVILNGEYNGCTFFEYLNIKRNDFDLKGNNVFPLTIALVEALENLSIQVHPNNECAEILENKKKGKNESWYFIKAPDGGKIYNGCIQKDKKKILTSLIKGDLSVIDELVVTEGDYVYVEGGTIHALSAGSYLYEIEETSESTYRLYDFGRVGNNGELRELHHSQAIVAMNTELKSVTRRYGKEQIEEKNYMTKRVENISFYQNHSNKLECLTLLSGAANVDGVSISIGMTIVLEPLEILKDVEIKEAIVATYC